MAGVATKTRSDELTLDEAYELVGELDLTLVKDKLCDPVECEGKGWTAERAGLVEREYVRFLILSLMSSTEDTVPSHSVDEFWHAHILDTHAYLEDTNLIFGRVLHHNPYFGRGGECAARELTDAYQRTLNRYQALFGTPPAEIWGETSGPRCRAYPPGPPPPGPPPPGPPPRCGSH
jgi:hypothetical protein